MTFQHHIQPRVTRYSQNNNRAQVVEPHENSWEVLNDWVWAPGKVAKPLGKCLGIWMGICRAVLRSARVHKVQYDLSTWHPGATSQAGVSQH